MIEWLWRKVKYRDDIIGSDESLNQNRKNWRTYKKEKKIERKHISENKIVANYENYEKELTGHDSQMYYLIKGSLFHIRRKLSINDIGISLHEKIFM